MQGRAAFDVTPKTADLLHLVAQHDIAFVHQRPHINGRQFPVRPSRAARLALRCTDG
jgi:hypothetical protein